MFSGSIKTGLTTLTGIFIVPLDVETNSLAPINLLPPFIKGGSKLMGAKLFVSTSSGTINIPVKVVNPVFIDPENKRLLS